MNPSRLHEEANHYYSVRPTQVRQKFMLRLSVRGHFIELASASGVFSKGRIDLGTLVLLETLELPDEGEILDMGCGYGIIGIAVAKLRPRLSVTMVDINPTAVRLARENLDKNDVPNAKVLASDLYSGLGDSKFDLVISNPPLAAGYKVVFPLIEGAYCHLRERGHLQMVLRKGVNAIPQKMESVFGNVETVSKKSGYRVFRSQKSSV